MPIHKPDRYFAEAILSKAMSEVKRAVPPLT